jgi:hypothetical protein
MRILLAVLLCFVLIQTECHALHASDGRGAPIDVVGTYAGVMLPFIEDEADPLAVGANAIAIFSLSVPQTGLATGAMLIFSEGRVFTGTINAFADPDRGTIRGILDATFDFTISILVVTDPGPPPATAIEEVDVTATAVGQLSAEVLPPLVSPVVVVNPGLARLDGRANLDISQGLVDANNEPIITSSLEFIVDGVKQTIEADANTTTDFTTATGG